MPLARYFLLVGGALLLVLLIAGACLPSPPVIERAEVQRTAIRIHSEHKLPERVVFDTSAPSASRSEMPVIVEIGTPTPASTDDGSSNAREAFARLQSSDGNRMRVAELKRPEPKPSLSRKSETRKRTAAPRKVRLARQPQFDWFGGGRMWW
jgi:hypothetical protein